MVVILSEADYDAWLGASANESRAFLTSFPADNLVTEAAKQNVLI